MSAVDLPAPRADGPDREPNLGTLIDDLPYADTSLAVVSKDHRITLGELRSRIAILTDVLLDAGVTPGMAVGTIVDDGAVSLVSMFASWRVGAVYVPINSRYTTAELDALVAEAPVSLLIGSRAVLSHPRGSTGAVVYEHDFVPEVLRAADGSRTKYELDVALLLRTSGTTGPPKAVLLRHSGTVGALDSSLRKLRRRGGPPIETGRPPRMNIIPTALSLWAGIYNTTFAFRAGFGVILMDKFSVADFGQVVREFGVRSTVLAPAMITMLVDDPSVADLAPLKYVRSITAPLSPEIARAFYNRFGAFVLNSYGQTELGGEVVGWTSRDVREFGVAKLGAAGRPYDDVDLQIRDTDGGLAPNNEFGEIYVNSPFQMRGYAVDGVTAADDVRFVDGYLRTGDLGKIDDDGFVWIQGRVTDMINRGGLKVYPDEVEEVLRGHPLVKDAAVAGIADRRLGEVPQAWIITNHPEVIDELDAWCRSRLVPYKVPVAFIRVNAFPRNEIGKVLRRDLAASVSST